MSETVTMRLVLAEHERGGCMAFWLEADGSTTRFFDGGCTGGSPLPVPLSEVEARHLPAQLQRAELKVTIGPVQQVAGQDAASTELRLRDLVRRAYETGTIPG